MDPMQLQRQSFDQEAWARDYFQVASEKTQERLAQFLILPDVRATMSPTPRVLTRMSSLYGPPARLCKTSVPLWPRSCHVLLNGTSLLDIQIQTLLLLL